MERVYFQNRWGHSLLEGSVRAGGGGGGMRGGMRGESPNIKVV